MEKVKLGITLGKLKLASPLVCASGTFGFGEELKGLIDFKRVGAIITKTLTLSPRAGNPPPRIYETDYGVINSVGLENPGLDSFLKDKLPQLKNIDTKFIISVGGFTFAEYETIIKRLDQEKAIEAFEINLSCPNIKIKKIISQDKKLTFDLTNRLRRLTKKTLVVKITPEVTNISEIAQAAESAGADAISLVNTFLAMAINIDTKKPCLGNIYGGYSGPAIKPMALYRVWQVSQNIKIPIIGGGGVFNAKDALEFFLAGATSISLGTINLVTPNSAEKIFDGINNYLVKNKISDIKQLKKMLRIN